MHARPAARVLPNPDGARRAPRVRRSSTLVGALKVFGRIVLSPRYRLRAEGRENIPPAGPGIFLVKHQFWTDIPLVTLAVPRNLHFVAKKELFEFPPVALFLTLGGGIPLDRQRPETRLESFRHLRFLLARGEYVVIFPEGTYFPDRMGPGKARLVEHLLKFWRETSSAPLPFIPVGIRYRGRWRRRVRVRIGPPLYARGPKETETLICRAMESIARLSLLSPG